MSDQPPVQYPRQTFGGDVEIVRKAQAAYSASSLATACYLLIMILAGVAGATQSTSVVLLVWALALAFLVLAIRASVVCANALGKSVIVAVIVTLLLILVPCGALFLLLIQQGRVGKVFKERGIKIGFLGPKQADIEAYIQRQQSVGGSLGGTFQ